MSHNQGVDSAPPSRRSVVKGAAWAVPAVVVAAAAPDRGGLTWAA